jgi:hypothetical protein
MLWKEWGELNLTFLRNMEVDLFISEKIHKPNAVSFELKCSVKFTYIVILNLI